MKRKILRVIDANYNRGKEALRVCEEIARFALTNDKLRTKLKQKRHTLTKILLALPVSYDKIIQERNIEKDLGKRSLLMDKRRPGLKDIFSSNIQRAEEATRVLEEFAKMFSLGAARRFQKLRFDLYELEKEAYKEF